jgi:hypothetical protein
VRPLPGGELARYAPRSTHDEEQECPMDAEWTDIVVIGMGPGGEDAAG